MQRLAILVSLLVILVGFVLLNITDTGASVINTDVADKGIARNLGEPNSPSASATITITMYAVTDDGR